MRKVRFSVEGPAMEVEIEGPSEAEWVEDLFSTYVVTSGASAPRALISIRTDADGGTLRTVDRIETFEGTDLMSAVEWETNLSLLATVAGYAHLHASGVVVDGGGVLAVGPSGSGKSSLAMAWHQAGRCLIGDDAILLGQGGDVRSFARLMKLDWDRARAFGIDVERTLGFDPTDREIWYDPSGGAGWATEVVPVRAVAWVRWRAGAGLRVRRLEPAEGLNHLLSDLLDTGLEPAGAFPALAILASEAELLHVEFDDAVEAAAVLARVGSAARGRSV
jgi:hypothetical protein